MSVDPDLRIAIGFILLLRVGIGLGYAVRLSEIGIFAHLRRMKVWQQLLVPALLTAPLVLFLISADGFALLLWDISPFLADYSVMRLPDIFRWLLLVPAVAGLLLAVWSRHSAVCPAERNVDDPPGKCYITGPFRFVRFPHVLADLLLFGPLLLATANWGAVLAFVTACLVLPRLYLRRGEQAWQELLGDGYGEYAGRTGALLPQMPNSTPQYSVPTRFGMSAILALVTMFAVIFGCINLLQTWITEVRLSPMLHLFFGVELLTIWICQMRFHQSPRRVSMLVGAILLPVFASFSLDLRSTVGTVVMIVLFFLGGIIGYCLGALAAGLFMVLDWLKPYSAGR
jgi:protein-S-isoprenylcysteine O-methyltransferase Ste14